MFLVLLFSGGSAQQVEGLLFWRSVEGMGHLMKINKLKK